MSEFAQWAAIMLLGVGLLCAAKIMNDLKKRLDRRDGGG